LEFLPQESLVILKKLTLILLLKLIMSGVSQQMINSPVSVCGLLILRSVS
jgi:hypothetical protein